jgi:thiamine biosynthesis protein ThiS
VVAQVRRAVEARGCEKILVNMKIQINGEARDFRDPLSLAALIEQLGMKGDRVAVELNREIVPRPQWDKTNLRDGDRLEIVHFVGGGAETSFFD